MTVGAVLAAAGLLFAASAQLADTSGGRDAQDLATLADAEARRVTELASRAEDLDAEVRALDRQVAADVPRTDPALAARQGVAAGTLPVTGPGLTVSLDDAPPSSWSISGATADDLVVHQQDLQDVINALWAGGAEAMTLQGERVTATSAFRCSGNILLLHGKVFSPPYVVTVVGDPDQLEAALDRSEGVQTYRDYVSLMNLGWAVQRHDAVELPAYSAGSGLRHAQVPDGTDVFS
ncbi:DUF881 domain-containing protein [Antribacter gilvus]|uniref:DUF881 domain-containing protein n=1 Tax=Antribacter gilvus TaxID=2304675 RepID=UPI001F0C09E2|nr:DUF881 domain-containing protein [Antribacter gilvus]